MSKASGKLGTEFGPAPGGVDFFAQSIDSMRVFEAVPTGGGGQENLLLITTSPASWEDNNQGVLWGYSVCAAGAPQLRFAVSIGPGASGYVPTLDQANGLVSLARLSSSVLIVNVAKAIEIWNTVDPRWGRTPTSTDVKSPYGAGQQAIIQPFYLANPWTAPDAGITLPAGTNWSAVMLPSLSASASGSVASVDVAVGYTQAGTGASGDALTGVPVWRKPYTGDTWIPESPYVGPNTPYGNASDRALKGPTEVTRGGTRLGVVSGITVKVGTNDPYPTNLVLALQLGGVPGTAGANHLAILDEQDPVHPKLLSVWPKTDILGTGVAFELLRKQPAVDPITNLVAVAAHKADGASGTDATWFILDLSRPETPSAVAVIPGMGWVGSLHGGYLTGLYQGQLQMVSLPVASASPSVKVKSVATSTSQGLSTWRPPILLAALCQTARPADVQLDFVTINQGVMRFLDEAHLAEDSRRNNNWKSKIPIISDRAAVIAAYVTDPEGLGRKVKVKLIITHPGVPKPLELEAKTKGKLSYSFDNTNSNQNNPNNPSDAALFTIPVSYLRSSTTPIQIAFSLSFVDASTQGSIKQPSPLNISPVVRNMTVHLVPVDYRTTNRPNSPNLPSNLAQQRADLEKRIQAMMPYSWNANGNSHVNVQVESALVYQEATYRNILKVDTTSNLYGYDSSKLFLAVSNDPVIRSLATNLSNTDYLILLIPKLTGVTTPSGSGVRWHPGATSQGTHYCYILENLPMDTVHELGHAHGRPHAPFVEGGGRIDSCDSEWPVTAPYGTAHIGVWGWDVSGVSNLGAIVAKAGGISDGDVRDAADFRDLMCYTNSNASKWISDYTFENMAQHTGPTGQQDRVTLEGALAVGDSGYPLCAPDARLRLRVVYRGRELGPVDMATGGTLSFTVSPAGAGRIVASGGKLYYQAGSSPVVGEVVIQGFISMSCPGNPTSGDPLAPLSLWQWNSDLSLEPKKLYMGTSCGGNRGIQNRVADPKPASGTVANLLPDDQVCYQVNVRFRDPTAGSSKEISKALYDLDPSKLSISTSGLSGASAVIADAGNAIVQYIAPSYASTLGGAGRLNVKYLGIDEGVSTGIQTGQNFMVEKYTVKIDATPSPTANVNTTYSLILYNNGTMITNPVPPTFGGDWVFELQEISGNPPALNIIRQTYSQASDFPFTLGQKPKKIQVDLTYSVSSDPDHPLEPRAKDTLLVVFP